jgi:glycosyltransferase involved in cell wall biosynthesis
MIKISVIIPVYNAEKYLRECLDSVIGQALQDIEIICVDDGSTDNSLSVLQEYAVKDARLKIVAQANQGAAAARNVGMAAAQGESLAFLDADDLYYTDALQAAYTCATKSNADMVVFEADFFDDKQGRLRTERLETKYLAGLQEFSAYAIAEFIFQISSCNTWNKLYKREFLQRSGLQYQELRTANDLCFVYSALACAGKIAVLKEPLVRHRVLHSGNLQSVKVKTPLDFMAALEQLKQNLQQFGLWEPLKRSYLNCAMFHCLYNWHTLDRQGKSQITAKSQEITELLEFAEHSADYYYSRNDYILMCKVVRFNRGGDVSIMGKLKNMLKHILPPPINAFNREVAGIKQMMLELNAGLLAQHKQEQELYNEQLAVLGEQQKEQIVLLDNKYDKQLAVFAEMNKQQLELLRQQQIQIAEIEQRQQQIQERLGELDKLTKLQTQRLALLNDVKAELNKPVKRDYAYYEDLFTNKYEKELKLWYKERTGEELNLQNPKTFNEKIQWMKLYDSTPLKTRLADKYLVRDWVAEKIGEEYLIPLLGAWDSFEDIDFDKLPERFVLKANHGYNWNYIVKDKSTFDKNDARAKFAEWLNTNFAFKGLEIQYMNIPPKIIAEEYLENGDSDLYDYKVFCFGGKAESIMYLSERKQGLKMAFFDLEWHKLPFTYSYPRNEADIAKPKNLDLLIKLAEKLSAGFPHVRVDFYILNDGSLKFGEMTFTTANGMCKWNPPEQNRIYGDLIKLPPKSPIPERI